MTKKLKGLRVDEVSSVDNGANPDAKILLMKRDDKTAWFTKDAGWSVLKEGQRVRIDYSGSKDVTAPKEFPPGSRTGGSVLVYVATRVEIGEE